MAYSTTDLVADIKLRAFIPTSQSTFEIPDILLMADAELQTTVLPLVMSLSANYYVTSQDHAITESQAAYDIPARAVGMKLHLVQLVNGETVAELTQMDDGLVTSSRNGAPEAYFIRGNQVHLYPTPSQTTGTLRLSFYLRPGKLITPTSAAQISAIDTATNQVTLGSIPSSWSTANRFDLVRQDGGHEALAIDLAASGVTGVTVTFAASLPSTLRTGDYVALAGESPLPQLPAELRPVLAQATATLMLESMGLPGAPAAVKRLEKEVMTATTLLTPRVEGGEQIVMADHGWL